MVLIDHRFFCFSFLLKFERIVETLGRSVGDSVMDGGGGRLVKGGERERDDVKMVS